MVVRVSDKTQNYSKVTKLLVKPLFKCGKNHAYHGIKNNALAFITCGSWNYKGV